MNTLQAETLLSVRTSEGRWTYMKDLESRTLMYFKATLLLAIGMLSSSMLVLRHPSICTAVLLALAIWAFSRAYYFAFYVIERYVDPSFRFSGLFAVAKYLLRRND